MLDSPPRRTSFTHVTSASRNTAPATSFWLDDRREPPPGWVWSKTPAETIAPRAGEVDELSLDHDLGLRDDDGRELTGYDVLIWIEEQVVLHRLPATTARRALRQLGGTEADGASDRSDWPIRETGTWMSVNARG